MNRIILREEDENIRFDVKEKEKVAIVGNAMGAGATLVASSYAKLVSMDKKTAVAFVEVYNRKPVSRLTYDILGMDKRFAGREYANLHKLVQRGSIRGYCNIDECINWVLVYKDEAPEMTTVENLRLINNVKADIVVYDIDIQSFTGDAMALEEILLDADRIIYVIDPMPSMLIYGNDVTVLIKMLETRGKQVCWVINKFSNGINRKELFRYLRLKNFTKLPALSISELYMCEYNCRIPYSCKTIRLELQSSMELIVNCHKKNTL